MRRGARPGHGIRRLAERLLLVGGVGCLTVWLAVTAEGWWTTARARSDVAAAHADSATSSRARRADGQPRGPWPTAPEEGEVIGLIEVGGARGVRAPVLEGATDGVLRRAVGHVGRTALPGQPGNCVLAGHRDSVFRGLEDVRRGDPVRLETVRGSYTYEVSDVRTVAPDAVEVLDPTDEETLTLLTCYPFNWVGPAPRRYVVRARRAGP